MSDTSLPIGDAYARAQLTAMRVQEQTGLTLADLAALPVDEYARLAHGQTAAETGIAAYHAEQDAKRERENPTPQQQAPAPMQAPAPDVDPTSHEYFLAWRAQRKSGGEGKGIFDSVPSQSDEYNAAVRSQIGRTGYSQGNVVEAPRLGGRYLYHDAQRDNRSAAQRFSTTGNAFGA